MLARWPPQWRCAPSVCAAFHVSAEPPVLPCFLTGCRDNKPAHRKKENCPHPDGATRQLGSRRSAERQTAFTLAAVQRCSDFAHSWPSLLIEIHRPTFKEGTGNGSGGGEGGSGGGGPNQAEDLVRWNKSLLALARSPS